MTIQIAASLLAANFAQLQQEIESIESAADRLHLDVMDGHFVPNISFGIPIIKDIKTQLPKDIHLMISDPLTFAKEFAPFTNTISFHADIYANENKLRSVIQEIKKLHVDVGVALNPDIPLDLVVPILDDIDYILIMSVFAGFGGQTFMPAVLEKVKTLREGGFTKDIHIDGGINEHTAPLAIEAGCSVVIAGTSIFQASDRIDMIQKLRGKT